MQHLKPVRKFLRKCAAFESLDEAVLDELASSAKIDYHKKDEVLFAQGKTRLEGIYIVQKGGLELSREGLSNEQDIDFLDRAGIYGALSILRHEGLSLRTGKTVEDTFFYLIPKETFLDICSRFPTVRNFFFSPFNEDVYQKSFQAVRHQSAALIGERNLLHVSCESVCRTYVNICPPETTAKQAAQQMTEANCDYIIVGSKSVIEGIVTDSDLRRFIIAEGRSSSEAIREFMSSPVRTAAAHIPVLQGLQYLLRYGKHHLPLLDAKGEVCGVVCAADLPQIHSISSLNLQHLIQQAQTPKEISDIAEKLPALCRNLLGEAYAVEQVNEFLTLINDCIHEKIVGFAVEKLGPPPCDFAFIVLGSEGREEQTLVVDQDNAIIYRGEDDSCRDYFLELGRIICSWLNDAGYTFCTGDIMANNSSWCCSLANWERLFAQWIAHPSPQALMNARIFFDLRTIYGNHALEVELRQKLFARFKGVSARTFFSALAADHCSTRPPIGFFRNFIVEKKGEHKDQLDLKKVMTYIVDFARILAFYHGIETTNTLKRLESLWQKNIINQSEYESLQRAYKYMMHRRLGSQLIDLEEGGNSANFISPYDLNRLEQELLKSSFRLIADMQLKLKLIFNPGL